MLTGQGCWALPLARVGNTIVYVDVHVTQVADVLARLAVTERASIDECHLDLTEEARRRVAACAGHPPLPVRQEQVHVSGQVSARMPGSCPSHCCGVGNMGAWGMHQHCPSWKLLRSFPLG